MPLPTAAELTDPSATNTQMKQRLGQLAENVADKEGLKKLEVVLDENAPKLIHLVEMPFDSIYSFAIADQNLKAAFLIKRDGTVVSLNQESENLSVANLQAQNFTIENFITGAINTEKLQLLTVTQQAIDSDYAYLIVGQNDIAAIAVKKDGSVIVDSVQSRKVTVFDEKYANSIDLDYGTVRSFGGTAITEVYAEPNEIKDCFWTWWINPIACRMGRTTYGGGVGVGDDEQNYGDIKIWQQRKNSLLKAAIIGKIETVLTSTDKTDDHNAPAILLDPRPDAKYPLTVFQADHSQAGSVTRMWRSRTTDVSGLALFGSISTSVRVTYSQAYRNPKNLDQIFVIIRHAGNAQGDWRILRSDDNGESWKEHKIFQQAGFYIGSRQSENGITLVFQRNVMSDVDTKVALTELRWDGSLVGFNNEVLIADVFALTSPVAPFALPNLSVIYESEAGTFRRVFDIREVSENKVQVLMAEFEKSESGATVKQDTSQFVLLTVDTVTGTVNRDDALPDAGNPMEASLQNAYFAGGCILGENDLILCRWNYPAGTNTGEMSRYTKVSDIWANELLDSAPHEICRPHIVERYTFENDVLVRRKTNTIVYMSGDYRTFTDMTVSTKIKELS